MLNEQRLHIRGKHKFKSQFIDLLYFYDTDDEKKMELYQKENAKYMNLDIPAFLVK